MMLRQCTVVWYERFVAHPGFIYTELGHHPVTDRIINLRTVTRHDVKLKDSRAHKQVRALCRYLG